MHIVLTKIRNVLLCVLLSAPPAVAGEFFVSMKKGSDLHCGSREEPFRTLQMAANLMHAGDICWIREGRYKAPLELDGMTGTRSAPIVFAAFPGENVTLDGSREITVPWEIHKDKIYSAELPFPVWQLFLDDRMVTAARWPNADIHDAPFWSMQRGMRYIDTFRSSAGVIYDTSPPLTNVRETDRGIPSPEELPGLNTEALAETDINFSGATAILNVGSWHTWARPVTSHSPGSGHFQYSARNIRRIADHGVYRLQGLMCLDAPNEWYYIPGTGAAYLYTPSGEKPTAYTIRGKVRDFNISAKNCDWIVFRNLRFFATTVRFTECRHLLVQNCHFRYPSCNKLMLTNFNAVDGGNRHHLNTTAVTSIRNVSRNPARNTILNCTFEYADGPVLRITGEGNTIENCFMHHIDWTTLGRGVTVHMIQAPGTCFRRNTIHTAGASEGICCGRESIIELNHLYNMGLLQHDGSAIQFTPDTQPGSIARFNWIHDCVRQGMRFDSTRTDAGSGGSYSNNVIWRVRANVVKGDRKSICNNVIFDSIHPRHTLVVAPEYGELKGLNRKTVTMNNIVDQLDSRSRSHPDIPGHVEHNVIGMGTAYEYLRDPVHLDFRPKPGCPLVDAGAVPPAPNPSPAISVNPDWTTASLVDELPASSFIGESAGKTIWSTARAAVQGATPDIGAYELNGPTYWIPGRKAPYASMPIPPDKARNVPRTADLIWLEACRAHSHMLYFGTSRETVANASPASAECRGHQAGNIFHPGKLLPSETYYWRVDAQREGARSVRKGNTWRFTTR